MRSVMSQSVIVLNEPMLTDPRRSIVECSSECLISPSEQTVLFYVSQQIYTIFSLSATRNMGFLV